MAETGKNKRHFEHNFGFYLICLEARDPMNGLPRISYWGSKGTCGGRWMDDMSQCTHYQNLRSANSKKAYVIKRNEWFKIEGRVFVANADANVTVEEI